jgi:hypothetical protein
MATNTKQEVPEPIEIDINDSSLIEGEALEYDLKEDFQARSAPPPKGRYKLRLFIDDEKIEKNLKRGFDAKDPNSYYYKKQVVCKIQDPTGKWQDSVVYWNASSGIPKGKKISSMVGMLQAMRVKIQPRMSELAVARLFIKAMVKLDGPIQIADCDWGGWDSTNTKRNDLGSTALIHSTGKLANTMLNFPKKADGSYDHITSTKEGLEIIAKLKIIKWVAPQEAAKVNGQTAPISVPKPAVVMVQQPEVQTITEAPLEIGEDGEVVLDI